MDPQAGNREDGLRLKIQKIERRIMEENLSAEEEAQAMAEIAKIELQLKGTSSDQPAKKPHKFNTAKTPSVRMSPTAQAERDILKSAQEKQKKGQKLDLFEARALFDQKK
jgi:hypothetical protein